MAAVGFGILFSGVISGYFAAAATGAILTFVLPVTIPAPNSAIPDRLEGWGLATGAGICALMLLWPPRRREDAEREAAGTLRIVADFVAADREQFADRGRLAREAVDRLGRRFLGSQHRPTGPTGPTAALASLPDELDWLLSSLAPSAESPALELACAEDAEAMAATAAVLRSSAARLEGGDERPDLARLDAARDAVVRALVRRLPELPADTPGRLAVGGARAAVPHPGRVLLRPPDRGLRAACDRRGRTGARTLSSCASSPRSDGAARGRARQRPLGVVPEQRSRRRRARRRRLHRAADRSAALVLGRARDALRAAVERARHGVVDRQCAGRDRGRDRRRGAARDRHRHASGECCGACCRSRSCSPPTRRARSRSPRARQASRSSSSCSSTSSSRSAGGWGSFASRTSRSASRSASGSASCSGRAARARFCATTLPLRMHAAWTTSSRRPGS